MQKLSKAWNKAPAGTPITADPAELASEKGAVLVDAVRLAFLTKHGFFRGKKEAAEQDGGREILPPGQPVKPPRVGPGDHNLRPEPDPPILLAPAESSPGLPGPGPASPRPDSGPKGGA